MEITTSLQIQQVKYAMKLSEKKYRDESKNFLIEGYHILEELKGSDLIVHVYVRKGCEVPNWMKEYTIVSDIVADKLSQTKSGSDIFAVVKFIEAKEHLDKKVLLLDGIQDPGNLGTIVRTAHSFGFDAIYCSNSCADIYNPKVVRATQGALFHLNIQRCDLTDKINELKDKGLIVIGTDVSGGENLSGFTNQNCAIVLGNEGEGVSKEVLALCDRKLFIETRQFESLNVGIACGIICYHFRG